MTEMLVPMVSHSALRAGKLLDLGLRRDLRLGPGMASCSRRREIEDGAGFSDESVGVKGLGHVKVGADLLAALAIELLSLGGEEDDVDVAKAKFVFDGVADVEAVLFGHHDVEEDEVGLLLADCFEGLFAVVRGEKVYTLVFELFQCLLDECAQMRFVVDNQYLHSFH
jgi:hypothetical protein